MKKLLQNSILQLRPVEPEDLDLVYQAENDTSIWWVGGQNGPCSRFILRQYLSDATGDLYTDKQLRLMAMRKEDGKAVGMIDLFDYSPQNQRAEVGILVFSEFREQGYARNMLCLLEAYVQDVLNMHQLYVYVSKQNLLGLKLFRGCGFTMEHELKEWLLVKGKYLDVLLFQKILSPKKE